ncbi:MAG TPA: trehalase family glycosidase [Roseiflexaceae bacterium]
MASEDYTDLMEGAKAVLDGNRVGSFTKPAPNLYPHQWSWDSAFIAMGYAHYDQARAEDELRSLFMTQWTNGLLPHIAFNPQATGYFPNPEVWRTADNPRTPKQRPTSGIVQPPVHSTAVLHIFRYAQDQDRARAFLAEMFPHLRDWHTYLYRERDPLGKGLVYIRHPWESGQDNSPLWDASLRRIQPRPDEIPIYRRVDTTIVDAADRPTNAEYDRYMYLVRLFADRDYDEARIYPDCPYLIQDVLFNSLLCQANRDLAEIARMLGEEATPFTAWAEQTAQALNTTCWDEEHGIYVDFDLAAGMSIPVHVAAGFAPLYAGIPSAEQAQRMYSYLNSPSFCRLDEACYPVPSYNRQAPDYSPNRYWRGPVWINVDWLLYHGLRRYGFDAYADRIHRAMIELVQQHGFYEYFDPHTGQGHGTDQFSWTAALLLDVLYASTIS